eukprot:CAMPEP_0194051624 /NCGR_PEP_ID=MMETSP0009_2-20130614/41498_1 /TAXON_ID=210454 /ORGANISM="Grammatophora oceanica, Strain CCMP 410" /LENGTH=60 /DNA_ID=CAMNT_0038698807 /DNA_START=657 /DNA_END=836 /DNA_ORIENTATION=-
MQYSLGSLEVCSVFKNDDGRENDDEVFSHCVEEGYNKQKSGQWSDDERKSGGDEAWGANQ